MGSEEAYAYTPGLKIKESMLVSKERKLPLQGKVLVEENQDVSFDTMVAETLVSGDPFIIQASISLGITPDALSDCMVKKIGEHVNKDEIIAKYSMFFGLIKRSVTSPVQGSVEGVSDITGQIVVRGSPVPVHIEAYIPGKVVKIIPREGAIVETRGAFIQGIFGIGGERHGEIRIAVDAPDDVLNAELVKQEDKGKILIGGSEVAIDALKKAVQVGASGIVVGGVESGDLKDFMGMDIGVAITGEEELGITMMVTEGFGKMNMHRKTFDIFRKFNGYMASINGATQIRAGVIRPEAIIPNKEESQKASEELSGGMVQEHPSGLYANLTLEPLGRSPVCLWNSRHWNLSQR